MERDFMGLTVKQETPEEEPIDAVPLRSTAMHWLFSSKGSGTVPQLLSFQDESPKTGFDSLISTGLVSLITTEGFDSDHKPYAAVQKGIVPEKQGGVHNMVTTYPAKHAVHRVVAAQTTAAVLPASGQNLINAVGGLSAQPLAGIPLTNPITAAPGGPTGRTTDLRNSPKISGMPAQLTIFYNGSVCVYDNILPEKAQAIMLLAGNGASPHHSIPVSVASAVISPPAAKPAGLVISSSKFAEPLKVGSPVGPVSSTFLPLGTVPQFRRKSLARFLEKRRERAMISASPYAAEEKSPECGLSTCPVPAIN